MKKIRTYKIESFDNNLFYCPKCHMKQNLVEKFLKPTIFSCGNSQCRRKRDVQGYIKIIPSKELIYKTKLNRLYKEYNNLIR